MHPNAVAFWLEPPKKWTTNGNDVAMGVKNLPLGVVHWEGGHDASPGPRREREIGYPTKEEQLVEKKE
jgi:hypothetical protein